MVKNLLKLEGISLFLLSLYFYQATNSSWLIFLILILVPDISMIGYLKDKKLGAITYNLVHNYILAIILTFIGWQMKSDLILSLGLILTAHVSLDRFFGFGLKYQANFKSTHLQKV